MNHAVVCRLCVRKNIHSYPHLQGLPSMARFTFPPIENLTIIKPNVFRTYSTTAIKKVLWISIHSANYKSFFTRLISLKIFYYIILCKLFSWNNIRTYYEHGEISRVKLEKLDKYDCSNAPISVSRAWPVILCALEYGPRFSDRLS